MKIYITNGEDTQKNYETVSPLLGHNIRLLNNELVANSECDEILAPDIIDYIPTSSLTETLRNYVSKMRKGSVISIGGTDLFMLCTIIVRRECSVLEANQEIFGGSYSHLCKNSLIGINDCSGLLEELGLKILSKTLDGVKYLVKAQRIN